MLYSAFELTQATMTPLRAWTGAIKKMHSNPLNPISNTQYGRTVSAACDLTTMMTRRYDKPEFGLFETEIDGASIAVHEEVSLHKPFCDLKHFVRTGDKGDSRNDPKVLIVAPMSGHYATLLRGTVRSMLPEHDVYITDWLDAAQVPLYAGTFDLDDYIDYLIEFTQFLGPNVHIIAVCQPSVPALAATALMAMDDDPMAPASLTLMGGPIDTRLNPTAVNQFASEHSIDWFRHNVIMSVPCTYPGFMRRVYPGFLQLSGFLSMNLDRHMEAQGRYFQNLIKGDNDSVEAHEKFYDEYLAVMDLTEEFYLQTVERVFLDHDLPRKQFRHRGRLIDCGAITKTFLITVEGENDDITGIGQSEAAQKLCENLPDDMRFHHLQPGVGHYGVFNGRRWREEIQPKIADIIRQTPVA